MRPIAASLALVLLAAACGPARTSAAASDADAAESATVAAAAPAQPALPPSAEEADARLAASPRHGEWAMVAAPAGDSVRAWVVYPERADRAPVVVVVHEIFGLTDWIRAVADQLAADGFIAIAPDLLTGKGVPMADGEPVRDAAVSAVRGLDRAEVQRRIDAVAAYGMALPAALPRYGIVGFCWGGSVSFAHAAHAPALGASVVYYGTAPDADALANVRAPVLGLYGGDDARVNATLPETGAAMERSGKRFEPHVFPDAGHGFLRQQSGQDGANLAATRAAWPRTVAWFRANLEE